MAGRERTADTASTPSARARSAAAGVDFAQSSEDDVGRLLAVLAASVPDGGRILELGTGTGAGLAWLVHGLGSRADVDVISVEADDALARLAAQQTWPRYVHLHHADGLDFLQRHAAYDLIFADAEAGKLRGLELALSALRPGGLFVVDDMTHRDAGGSDVHRALQDAHSTLLSHPDLVAVDLAWASGVVIAVRARR